MGKQATVSLQTPCLPARIEEGTALQPRDWLDQMLLGFLSSLIFQHLPDGTRSTAGFVPSPIYLDALDLTISEVQVAVS